MEVALVSNYMKCWKKKKRIDSDRDVTRKSGMIEKVGNDYTD